MKSALLLDVVVRKSSTILKLLSSKDQPLLAWGNSLLVLDLGLDILNGVRWLNLQGDGLASEGFDKDLHTSSQSEHKMKSALLLDVVVREGSSILKLLSSKDQPLLVWGNSLLVLDLGLDILNGVRWLNLQGDGLASEGLDKDLHTSSQSGCCSQRGFFHPQAAYQQRSASAGLGEFPPCPGSWPRHSQWSQMAPPP